MGVLTMPALLFEDCVGAPDFWKLLFGSAFEVRNCSIEAT